MEHLSSSELDRLCGMKFWESGNWYAILDSARDPEIRKWLNAGQAAHQSLYEGEGADREADWAPYLVTLDDRSARDSLLIRSWGNCWGVYLQAKAEFTVVRSHFRRYLTVRMVDGKTAYFRFYDPRVLHGFLPTCTPVELKDFFGPAQMFLAESPDSSATLLSLLGEGNKLERETVRFK